MSKIGVIIFFFISNIANLNIKKTPKSKFVGLNLAPHSLVHEYIFSQNSLFYSNILFCFKNYIFIRSMVY